MESWITGASPSATATTTSDIANAVSVLIYIFAWFLFAIYVSHCHFCFRIVYRQDSGKSIANRLQPLTNTYPLSFQLGGLQFDREVRAIVGYLSQVSEWGVREQLTRLTQMATLLNLENLAEVIKIHWAHTHHTHIVQALRRLLWCFQG